MAKSYAAFEGNWGSYDAGERESYPDDEEAVKSAVDEMFSMCGNAGQEAMLGEILADFDSWALDILEMEGYAAGANDGSTWESFTELVLEWYDGREDKRRGTVEILARGWEVIANQSGYHDKHDERGEGAGQEF